LRRIGKQPVLPSIGIPAVASSNLLEWRRGESPAWALPPRAVRCGVPQGAQFIREWGGPARAAAIAARRRAVALPCVVLFLANRSAPFAGSTPHGLHQAQKGRSPLEPRGSACPCAWWRRGESTWN